MEISLCRAGENLLQEVKYSGIWPGKVMDIKEVNLSLWTPRRVMGSRAAHQPIFYYGFGCGELSD